MSLRAPEMAPCPDCGAGSPTIWLYQNKAHSVGNTRWVAHCKACNITEEAATKVGAVKAWNIRPRSVPFVPTGETVIFVREDRFYPVQLSGLKPTTDEAADHAACNPGTLRIEDLQGKVIWPEGTKQ